MGKATRIGIKNEDVTKSVQIEFSISGERHRDVVFAGQCQHQVLLRSPREEGPCCTCFCAPATEQRCDLDWQAGTSHSGRPLVATSWDPVQTSKGKDGPAWE